MAARAAPLDRQPRDRGARQSPGRAAVHPLVPHPVRRQVPAPQLRRRAAQRPVRHPGPRRMSCAGPYGHRLLAIGPARSHALREEIGHGCDGVKPGWTRVNLNYFISPATVGYIAAAVELIAAGGYRLLPDYRFDPRPACGGTPPGRPGRRSRWPGRLRPGWRDGLPAAARPGRRGRLPWLPAAGPGHPGRTARPPQEGSTGLPPEFEALRWFPLPPACLQSQSARSARPG